MNRLLPSGPLMEHPMPEMGRLGKPVWIVAARDSLEVKEAENKFFIYTGCFIMKVKKFELHTQAIIQAVSWER